MIAPRSWRRPRSIAAAAVLTVTIGVASGCGGGGGDVPSNAVAVVGGTDITLQQVDDLMSQAQQTYKQRKQNFPKKGSKEWEALQQQAIQHLVEVQELEVGAQEQNVTVTDADINKKLDQIKAQFFTDTKTKKVDEKKYQQALKQQGITEDQLKDTIKQQLLQQKLFDALTKNVHTSDAKITQYYNQNKKTLYTTPATRHVRHILVKDKKTADKLYDQLRTSDKQFAALAKKYSTDPGSKTKGGDLGNITKGQTVPQFDKEAFSIEPNIVSKPVKTQFGYHLIEALGAVKPATTKKLDAALKSQIKTQLEGTQKQKAFFDWFQKLDTRLKKKIKYAKGYAPPATTAAGTTASTSTTG
jgi:foldase protein PrsA